MNRKMHHWNGFDPAKTTCGMKLINEEKYYRASRDRRGVTCKKCIKLLQDK